MRATSSVLIVLLAISAVLLPSTRMAQAASPVLPALFPQAVLEPVTFAAISGWSTDTVAPAFTTFRRSCAMMARRGDGASPPRPVFTALRATCRRALRLPQHPREHAARAFFQREFVPYRIAPLEQPQGFLTGYYEPEVEGSRVATAAYATPLYRRPPDLILEAPPTDGAPANKGKAFRREPDGLLTPYPDRAAIEDGALAGKGLEVAWIKDPADAFFAHIQGSVRVRLPDGAVLRLNYDGHNGQGYTPIGRLLIERNLVPREKMSMDAIRAYIAAHPEEGRALMRQNKSYVFFREATELGPEDGAVGAQGVPLTAVRSIAVDRNIHVYGTPFFIAADLPTGRAGEVEPFRHLTIAQDTGSAIIGPARADIFFGAGTEAGAVAGRIQHPGAFVILLPRALDPARVKAPLPRPRPDIPQPAAAAP